MALLLAVVLGVAAPVPGRATAPGSTGAPVATAPGRACVDDACFAPSFALEGHELALRGAGLLRYWGFHVYAAALYAPASERAPGAHLGDFPMVLRLHYFREISRDDIVKAADVHLARDPAVDLVALRPRLEQIHASYRDVGPGDEYQLRYAPSVGTTLVRNGQTVLTVPGADFARAYFGLWLGQRAIDDGLRRDLLGDPA